MWRCRQPSSKNLPKNIILLPNGVFDIINTDSKSDKAWSETFSLKKLIWLQRSFQVQIHEIHMYVALFTVCCTIYCKLQSYCSPLRNVTTIRIITTYIQSIIKGNRMKYVPKNHYPNYQYTFHWSTSNDSYGLIHTETELWCGKHPETVEFWLLVKRLGMASGLKLQLLLYWREFNPF